MKIPKYDKEKTASSEEKPKIIDEGFYEVVISKYTMKKVKKGKNKGKEFAQIDYKIRKDIKKQNFKNWTIFGDYIAEDLTWKIGALASCLDIPEGEDFEDLEDFLKFIKGQPLKVSVGHEEQEGYDPKAKVMGYYDSEVPLKTIAKKTKKKVIEVDDDVEDDEDDDELF